MCNATMIGRHIGFGLALFASLPCKHGGRLRRATRQRKSTNVPEIKIGDQAIRSSTVIAEAFNSHFTNIGQDLAREIPETDVNPLSYLTSTSNTFSFEQIDVLKVSKLLNEINGRRQRVWIKFHVNY